MASPTNAIRDNNAKDPKVAAVEMKLEVIVIPVAGRPAGVRRLGICHGSEPDEESDKDDGEHGPRTHGGL